MSGDQIGDVARRFGTTPRALRFYEDRGLVQPVRNVYGKRLFPRVESEKVRFILQLQRFGYTLTQIKELIAAGAPGARPRLSVSQLEEQLHKLTRERDKHDRRVKLVRAALDLEREAVTMPSPTDRCDEGASS